ncbi:MAG: hypothetical protein PHE27_07770 [Alphaproteobacteria bacterium]|nr:hypothetical protein [Alphaproteobacteria bacterium]
MNARTKKIIIGDVLTGLLVAATFAAIVPGSALADLQNAVQNAEGEVGNPFLTIVGYISYGIGTVMTVAGIAQAKKHADAPGNNPLGPALGRLGAGAAFLAAPALVGMISKTGADTLGSDTAQFSQITF